MIKLIQKEDCTFEHGYVLCGNNIVPIPYHIYHQLNNLEELYQKAVYVAKQPDSAKAPSIEGFKREWVLDEDLPVAVPDTPTIDAKVQETLAFLDDLASKETCRKINEYITRFKELFKFVKSDVIKDDDNNCVNEIDLKYIGDPLKLTEGRMLDMIDFIVSQEERCSLRPAAECFCTYADCDRLEF